MPQVHVRCHRQGEFPSRHATGVLPTKSLLAALALTTALAAPGFTAAKPVTLTTILNDHSGNGAYLAHCVTDASGAYAGTFWMAGNKSKYYEYLSGGYRATSGDIAEISGITGAGIGPGRPLKISLDLADALFDGGHKLHIDASIEDMRDSLSEIAVPLTRARAGKPASSRRYIRAFTYDM
jgi:hypothetical protein